MFRPLPDDRPAAGRLAGLRAAGRDGLAVVDRAFDPADRVEELFALGEAGMGGPDDLAIGMDRDLAEPVVLRRVPDGLDRVVLLVDDAVRGLVDEDLVRDVEDREEVERGLVADRLLVETRLVVEARPIVGAPTAGLAVDMILAAAVSAFAAVVMALVAVFIACIAVDMVLADVVALVAAAVIFVAADVTLVAADDTVLAADAGVVELRDELRVGRGALPTARAAVMRDAGLRVEVLRVDRDAGLRAVDDVVLRVGLDVELRVERDDVRLADDVVLGRLAVPDALRLADLLRPVLAELRRLAALVVLWIGTDFPPS